MATTAMDGQNKNNQNGGAYDMDEEEMTPRERMQYRQRMQQRQRSMMFDDADTADMEYGDMQPSMAYMRRMAKAEESARKVEVYEECGEKAAAMLSQIIGKPVDADKNSVAEGLAYAIKNGTELEMAKAFMAASEFAHSCAEKWTEKKTARMSV